MTSGRGQFSMEFSHYAPCPKIVSEDFIAKSALRFAKCFVASISRGFFVAQGPDSGL